MPDFDKKAWLDEHVVPLLQPEPTASLYTVFWHGAPPKEVLVFLKPVDGARWGELVRRILQAGFTFDFLRDVAPVVHEGKKLVLFGGDGTPLFDKGGHVSARLHRKLETGTSLIIQVSHQCETGVDAAMAVKNFFAQWDERNPFDVCTEYSAQFGQA